MRALLAVLVLALAALAAVMLARRHTPPPEIPPLRIGYRPSEPGVADRRHCYEALAAYLRSRLGRPVDIVEVPNYLPAIESLRKGEIDLCAMGSLAFLIAEQEGTAEALVMRVQPGGTPRTYHSVLIVPGDSPLGTIDDVRRNSSSTRLAFVSQQSTSGFLIPTMMLRAEGVQVTSFADVSFAGSHTLALLLAAHGDRDLCAVSETTHLRLAEEGTLEDATVRVLWRSPPIPSGPLVARKALDAPTREALRTALVEMSRVAPENWKRFIASYPDADFAFVPYDPTVHEGLRSLVIRALPEVINEVLNARDPD